MDAELKNKSLSRIKDFIANSAFSHLGMEVCGFVGYDDESKEYIVTLEKNQSSQPQAFFSIDPVRFLIFKNKYSFLGVFHSHILGDESPSEFDIKMSEASCIPFVIYSINTRKFYIHEPKEKEYDVNIIKKLIKILLR